MKQVIDRYVIPILPGDDLEIHVGRNYTAFYGRCPTQKIKAGPEACVYVEDWV